MPLSDTAARDIAEVLRKHVDQKTLAQIVDELLEIRGDKVSARSSKSWCTR